LKDLLLRGLLGALEALAGVSSIEGWTRFGVRFGGAWFAVGAPRVALVREQLSLAFPDWDEARIRAETRAVFEHLGESLAEFVLLLTRHREALIARVEIEGLERLERARQESASGGVLVVSAHRGNWELAGIALARQGFPVTAIRREQSSSVLEEAIDRMRIGPAAQPSPTGPTRPRDRQDGPGYEFLRMGSAGLSFARALSQGRVVLVLLDQNAKRDEGVFVPFFGRPASTRPGPLRLALRRDVPVVPVFARRVARAGAHRIEVGEPLALDRSAASGSERQAIERENLIRVNAAIEEAIRRVPSQWIWPHRRWRTQPRADSQQPEENRQVPG
jgi:KDO2-lipid IV(A) lauroyltransferase